MKLRSLLHAAALPALLMSSGFTYAHGLMESPPSRNYFCGVLTKPHEVNNPDVQYPQCKDAFEGTGSDGYNFMAVLTHTRGALRPLPPLSPPETPPQNEAGSATPDRAGSVCGYDSEMFGNGPTLWDRAIDWPTNNMSAGRNKITWNISWGPHFDDTQEFHYWITKPGFTYQIGQPLSWSDLEAQPFCKLDYSHSTPNANPDVVARVADAKFDTYCDIPQRSGRHVIYGEWGRNYFTWERFHGCIDANFGGSGPIIAADIDLTPSGSVTGAGTLTVDGSNSTGSNLSYSWSILNQSTDATYTFANPQSSTTTLQFGNPSTSGDVTVALTVRSGAASNTATQSFRHEAEGASSQWENKGALSGSATTYNVGDELRLRIVSSQGVDTYVPTSPLLITANNQAADQWPLALAQAVNAETNDIAVGILNAQDQVVPTADATANQIYASANADVTSVFLDVTPANTSGGGQCEYTINNEWNSGFTASISINNTGSTAIEGWAVNWSYSNGDAVSNLWNADLSGSYTASNLSWNARIEPGQSVEFGFQGTKGGANAEMPEVTGAVCSASE